MLVYHIEPVDYLMDEKAFAAGYAHVPKYRQEKIDNLKRTEDKCLSLGAELLLERLFRENGFHDLADNRMGYYTKQGKPFVLRPEQASYEKPPVQISISHSKNYTMVVLSDSVIGCDIEFANPDNANCLALARRFFNEEEAGEVEADKESFYRLWTLKEAYTKCTQIPLPVVLKMNMKQALENPPEDRKVKALQGGQNGYVWSIVYYE